MPSFSITSHSPRETINFGRRLGGRFVPGVFVALIGGLGSGKTTLIQGFAKGLHIKKESVKSPTFVIFHIYNGKFPVYHFDLYRLEKETELEAIGFEEFISDRKAVSFVEWAERGKSFLPKDRLTIYLNDVGNDIRKFKIKAEGPFSEKVLKEFIRYEHSRN